MLLGIIKVVAATHITSDNQISEADYLKFCGFFGKSHKSKEDFQKRFEIYKQNTQQILEIDQTTLTSNHRPNFMSDFTEEEKKVLFGFEPPKKKPSAPNNLI